MSTPAEPARRPVKGWLIAAVAILAGLGLIAGLGGFERRQVATAAADPGAEVDAHNLVFRLDSATVQYLAQASSRPWKVVVSGSVRNPTDETLYPMTGPYGNLIALADGAQPEATGDYLAGLGPSNPDTSFNPRQVVPPNNQWMTLTATYRFDEFPETGRLEIRVVPMEFTANIILGLNSTPAWNVASYELPTAVMLPLTRLPDGDY